MSKKARKEGNRVATLIKANKAEVYIADVDVGDNPDDVAVAANSIVRTLGKTKAAFMIVAPSSKQLVVVVYVPNELKDRIDAKQWILQSTFGVGNEGEIGTVDDGGYIQAILKADNPFKVVDAVRGNGFAHLNRLGLMGEEESSEEFFGFDDL